MFYIYRNFDLNKRVYLELLCIFLGLRLSIEFVMSVLFWWIY